MKTLIKLCVGVLLTGLVLGLTPVRTRADEKPPEKPPVAVPVTVAEGELTLSSLKVMLDGLAYDEIVANKSDKGEVVGYMVKMTRDNWTFAVNVFPSAWGGNKYIEFSAWLGKVPDPANVPSKVLLGLLTANDKVYPLTFTYSEKWTQFKIFGTIPNKNVQAKDVRKMMDNTTNAIKEYAPLWSSSRWPGSTPKTESTPK